MHFRIKEIEGKFKLGYFEQKSHFFVLLGSNDRSIIDEDLNELAHLVEEVF